MLSGHLLCALTGDLPLKHITSVNIKKCISYKEGSPAYQNLKKKIYIYSLFFFTTRRHVMMTAVQLQLSPKLCIFWQLIFINICFVIGWRCYLVTGKGKGIFVTTYFYSLIKTSPYIYFFLTFLCALCSQKAPVHKSKLTETKKKKKSVQSGLNCMFSPPCWIWNGIFCDVSVLFPCASL